MRAEAGHNSIQHKPRTRDTQGTGPNYHTSNTYELHFYYVTAHFTNIYMHLHTCRWPVDGRAAAVHPVLPSLWYARKAIRLHRPPHVTTGKDSLPCYPKVGIREAPLVVGQLVAGSRRVLSHTPPFNLLAGLSLSHYITPSYHAGSSRSAG